MRITSQIMQNNALAGMNRIKGLEDKLHGQYVSEQKITRPSDDPIIAIRSLRLNTSLSQIQQYNERNVEDANKWVDLTDDALTSAEEVLKNLLGKCNELSSEESKDSGVRKNIIANMSKLLEELYAIGDSDYMGSGLFTGYRTDTKLRFEGDLTQQYEINEKFDRNSISTIDHVKTGDILDVNKDNYDSITTKEGDVGTVKVDRIRLAYDTLSTGVAPSLTITNGAAPPIVKQVTTTSINSKPSPYETIANNPDAVLFIPETGEMLLGANVSAEIKGLPAGAEVNVSYEKTQWQDGDLRPEHYFTCTSDSDGIAAPPILYNAGGTDQFISYDVGYNQTQRINTLAKECFTHDIGRDVKEMLEANNAVIEIEGVIAELESMLGNSTYNQAEVNDRLDAAKKVASDLKAKEKDLFSKGITNMEKYRGKAALAGTEAGSRGERLDLVKTRLTSQQANFKALEAENIGVDETELLVLLTSAATIYDGALKTAGMILQNSLMNFI